MKAIVNEGCIGCGLCASTCPAVFTLEDGVAVAMAGDIPEDELPAAAEAASPPVSAPPVRVHTAAHIHCSSFSRSSLLYVSGSSRRGP